MVTPRIIFSEIFIELFKNTQNFVKNIAQFHFFKFVSEPYGAGNPIFRYEPF